MVIMVQRREKKTVLVQFGWWLATNVWDRVGATAQMGPTFHRQPPHQLQSRQPVDASDTGWFSDPSGAPSTIKPPLSKWTFVVGSSPVRWGDRLKHVSVSNPDLDRFGKNMREKQSFWVQNKSYIWGFCSHFSGAELGNVFISLLIWEEYLGANSKSLFSLPGTFYLDGGSFGSPLHMQRFCHESRSFLWS